MLYLWFFQCARVTWDTLQFISKQRHGSTVAVAPPSHQNSVLASYTHPRSGWVQWPRFAAMCAPKQAYKHTQRVGSMKVNELEIIHATLSGDQHRDWLPAWQKSSWHPRFMRSFITAVYCWPFMFIYTVLYCTNAVIGSMHVSYFSEIFQE